MVPNAFSRAFVRQTIRNIDLYEIVLEQVIQSAALDTAWMSEETFQSATLNRHQRQHRLQVNLVARKSRLELELQEHLEKYFASWCHAFCEQMQDQLPREMKDIVYGYIFEDRICPIKERPEGWRFIPNPPADIENALSAMPSEKLRYHGHVADVHHVGEPTLRELGEFFYRVTTFSVWLNDHNDSFRFSYFLSERNDPWRIGPKMSDLARMFDFEIWPEERHSVNSFVRVCDTLGSVSRKLFIRVRLDLNLHALEGLGGMMSLMDTATDIVSAVEFLVNKGHDIMVTLEDQEIARPMVELRGAQLSAGALHDIIREMWQQC
ncbi:hypothetical protein FB567DRAFT_220279 [Paraphoma chrysanthemicola]|uniref:Uncharacterized protein n=1 Tax=Paraphoma chrysanthemicola TaxID=798071 RepID=A0A8K0VRV4_9PLEO|nr:hypothetical protein FB567DRAFT_220279 [Paraphoma chrysanthemicola]